MWLVGSLPPPSVAAYVVLVPTPSDSYLRCFVFVVLSYLDTHWLRSDTVFSASFLCCSDGRSIEMLGMERSWTSTGVLAAFLGIVPCKPFWSGRRQLTDSSQHAYRCCGLGQRGHTHLSRSCTICSLFSCMSFKTLVTSELQHHSCALLNGGTMKCWGQNDHGQVTLVWCTEDSVPTHPIFSGRGRHIQLTPPHAS